MVKSAQEGSQTHSDSSDPFASLQLAPVSPLTMWSYPVTMLPILAATARLVYSNKLNALLTPFYTRILGIPLKSVPLAALFTLYLHTYFLSAFLALLSRAYHAARTPGGGLDNNNPRAQKRTLTGVSARLNAVHENMMEAFGGYAAAVIVAQVSGKVAGGEVVPLEVQINCGLVMLVARAVYHVFYAVNIGPLRTISYYFPQSAAIILFCTAIVPGFEGYLRSAVRA
ncbi:hypothetical protein GQ42DRAFT_74367 [Ramicandelaber brevisporus]|nr:hypothetical protein GQ42DRAFT_74367 [Ramicandelaber brevisporus]